MASITVYTGDRDKCIYISQEHQIDDDAIVYIYPDQLDLLIEWLQEAKRSLQNGETS